MAAKVYDPDQIIVTFASLQIKGFADGSFLTIEQMSEGFTSKVGSDGEVTRTKTNDKRCKIRLSLMQTSDSNDILTAIHNLDLREGNGAGVAPFGVADKSGRFLFIGPETWVVKAPSAEFSREPGGREWEFECAEPERFDGGS